jgi:hypothetical protein
MPQITQAEVTNPIALGQDGEIDLSSTATQGGALTGSVRLSLSNDVFIAPQLKTINVAPNDATTFRLVRRPAPNLTSPLSVIFFITVREAGVAAESKRQRLVNIG